MKTLVVRAIVVTALCALVAPVQAQTANRRILGLISVPGTSGLSSQDCLIYTTIGTQVGVSDVSTDVEILVDGDVVASIPVLAQSIPGGTACTPGSLTPCSTAGCGVLSIGTQTIARRCEKDPRCNGPTCACACQSDAIIVEIPGGVPRGPDVQVRLVAAPGSLPDSFLLDNTLDVPPSGPIYWNRLINEISVDTPLSGSPTINVNFELETSGIDFASDMGMIVELRQGATPVGEAEQPTPFRPDQEPCATCAGSCGSLNATTDALCSAASTTPGCACGGAFSASMRASLPLSPGDEITVILRPAPGSMPEVPELSLEDSIDVVIPSPCAGDANFNLIVNGADLSVLLSQFGQQTTLYDGADFNGDAIVNGADLSVLLSNFGNDCLP